MKFLHAADIHLDSPLRGLERYEGAPAEQIRGATRRALENLVDLAIGQQVNLAVIAGDLYDGDWRDFNTGMFFVRQMAKLRDAGIRVYLIAGNHDAASTMTRNLRLPTNPEGDCLMLSSEQAETRRIDDLGVSIHGQSFATPTETRNLVLDYPVPVPLMFNLGMLHTSLSGSDEHDTYAPCTPADLRSRGYDYWALGHIHKRSLLPGEGAECSIPPVLYSGNIQGRHIKEPGAHGCFIVTVEDRQSTRIDFHPLDVFRWEACQVNCANANTLDDVVDIFRSQLRELIQRHGALPLGIRVLLTGSTRAHQRIASHRTQLTAEIRTAATIASDGRVWIEQIKISTIDRQDRKIESDTDGPLQELVRYLDELPYNAESLAELAEELKDLARKLPGELTLPSDGLHLDQAEWLQEVVRDIKPMLLDRLKG